MIEAPISKARKPPITGQCGTNEEPLRTDPAPFDLLLDRAQGNGFTAEIIAEWRKLQREGNAVLNVGWFRPTAIYPAGV